MRYDVEVERLRCLVAWPLPDGRDTLKRGLSQMPANPAITAWTCETGLHNTLQLPKRTETPTRRCLASGRHRQDRTKLLPGRKLQVAASEAC